MNLHAPRPGPLRLLGVAFLFLVLVAPLGGCAGWAESGFKRWRPEPAERVFVGQPPPDKIRITHRDTTLVLEGARVESDTIIGFREMKDGWARIAIPADSIASFQVRKVDSFAIAFAVLSSVALVALSGS